jgi:hypothetical protein
MDLFKTLKELKKIEPERDFTDNSRRVILAHEPIDLLSPHRILTRFIAIASSVALAGALIFIIAGGFSATKLAPRFSSIDPTALRAEAQAIDTQINLLNINYTESTISAKSMPGGKSPATINNKINASSSAATSTPAVSALTPTSTLSVDAILQQLSQ